MSEKDWTNCGRTELINVIETQRTKLAELAAEISTLKNCLVIKGWWCMYCDIFNGEEKEVYLKCRHCEKDKKVRDLI